MSKTGTQLLLRTILLMLCLSSSAKALVISGLITKSAIGPDGNPVGDNANYLFEVVVSTDRYRITSEPISGINSYKETIGTDGIDCYAVQKRWDSLKAKADHAAYQETAQVTPGLFPSLATTEAQLLWIMFASGGMLTNGHPLLLSHITHAPYDELRSQIRYTSSKDWPDHVAVFSPGFLLASGNKIPLPPPFEHEYKLWEFSTRTSDLKSAYPGEGSFIQYSVFVENEIKKAEHRAIRKINILVTNNPVASSIDKQSFLPPLSRSNLMVIDYRFSSKVPRPGIGDVGAIQYRLKHDRWLDRSNGLVNASGVSLQKEIEMAEQFSKPSSRRYVILALIIALTAVPLFVFFAPKLRKPKSN